MAPVVAREKRPGFLDPVALEAMGAAVTQEAEMPGGVPRFCEMLRGGGVTDVDEHGVRIFSPAMIDLASKVHTGTMPNGLMDYTINFRGWPVHPADLRLGFFLRGETLYPTPFGTVASPRTFGGLGAGPLASSSMRSAISPTPISLPGSWKTATRSTGTRF